MGNSFVSGAEIEDLLKEEYGDLLDVWDDDMTSEGIDWKNSTVSNNCLSFVSIRIVNFRNEMLSDEEQEALNEKALFKKNKKVGRPSMEEAISYVYQKMDGERKLDFTVREELNGPVYAR